MRKAGYFVGTLTAGALALSAASPGVAAATKTVAIWEMNERANAATMVDTGDNGIDGTIGSAVITGKKVDDGGSGYQWSHTAPNQHPAKPERLVVLDDRWLKPGNADYAVTVRFRTTRPFGNIIQKGQSQNRRGFFKWQIPHGKLTCVFRGYDASGNRLSRAVNSGPTPLNDGKWHVVTCKRTEKQVRMTVDGSLVRRALGPTGRISNKVPLTIGGKSNCDQVTTTCDYFVGSIDYVRIARG